MELKILVILVGLHVVYFIAKNVDSVITYIKGQKNSRIQFLTEDKFLSILIETSDKCDDRCGKPRAV